MDKIGKILIQMEEGSYNKEIPRILQKMLSVTILERPSFGEVISNLKSLKNPTRKRGFSLMNFYQSNVMETE